MKVLVISSFFPSSEQDKLPQFLLDQALAFANQYPDDEFIYLAASRANKQPENLNLPANLSIHRFSYFWPRRYQLLTEYGILSAIKAHRMSLLTVPFLFFFEYLAIRKLIKKIKPDYVYSHWMLPQGVLAHKLCKKIGIKHVLTSHSSDIEILFRMGRLGKRKAISVLRNLTQMNVVSQRGQDFLAENLATQEMTALSEKLSVIPMGVPDALSQEVESMRQKLSDSQRIELLFMGRLAEKKGIFFLLEAISVLQKDLNNLHLTIAGEGLLQEEIKEFIQQHQLSDIVTLTGFVGGQAKTECLARTDIFILPSFTTESGDREGLPVTLIENMSCGNLCIATHGSGAEELITDGVSGLLVPAQDVTALVDSVRTLLAESVEAQTMMGSAAQEASHHLRWQTLIQTYYKTLFQ